MNRIVFTCNFFRWSHRDEPLNEVNQRSNLINLFILIYPELKYSSDVRIDIYIPKITSEGWLRYRRELPEWSSIYFNDIPDYLEDEVRSNFSNALVIGFEIPPSLKNIIENLGSHYVDIQHYPLRFTNNNIYGITSSDKNLGFLIDKYRVKEEFFYDAAFKIKKKLVEKSIFFDFPDSLLVIGQTEADQTTIQGSTWLRLEQFCEDIRLLSQGCSHIFFAPHPLAREQRQTWRMLRECCELDVTIYADSIYRALCEPAIKKSVTIGSSAGVEAKYFCKESHFLNACPIEFYSKFSAFQVLPLFESSLRSLGLWREILQHFGLSRNYGLNTYESSSLNEEEGINWNPPSALIDATPSFWRTCCSKVNNQIQNALNIHWTCCKPNDNMNRFPNLRPALRADQYISYDVFTVTGVFIPAESAGSALVLNANHPQSLAILEDLGYSVWGYSAHFATVNRLKKNLSNGSRIELYSSDYFYFDRSYKIIISEAKYDFEELKKEIELLISILDEGGVLMIPIIQNQEVENKIEKKFLINPEIHALSCVVNDKKEKEFVLILKKIQFLNKNKVLFFSNEDCHNYILRGFHSQEQFGFWSHGRVTITFRLPPDWRHNRGELCINSEFFKEEIQIINVILNNEQCNFKQKIFKKNIKLRIPIKGKPGDKVIIDLNFGNTQSFCDTEMNVGEKNLTILFKTMELSQGILNPYFKMKRRLIDATKLFIARFIKFFRWALKTH